MTGVNECGWVFVVGPGLDSTHPAFVRSRTSQATGSDGRLAQKRNRGPISGGRGCVDIMCADVCSIPTSYTFFHSSIHCFPTSLSVMRWSKEQGCVSWEYCNMSIVVSSALPQARGVCCVELPLLSLCLAASVPVRKRLRHFHVVHGLS